MISPTHATSVIRRDMQHIGTWDDFVASVGAHVAGPKGGRCVFPYRAEWAEGETQQLRAGAHKRPGARWSIVSLDLDECSDEQMEMACKRLDELQVSYLCHSTHSYDPAERMKARLHVPLAVEQTEAQIQVLKVKLATLLGLRTDAATKGGYSAFFTPRCPEERLADAFLIVRRFGPLWPELLPELDSLPETGLTQPKRANRVVAPRAREAWPEDVVAAADAELADLCEMVGEHTGKSIRNRLKGGVSVMGGYIASGLLDETTVREQLRAAVKKRHSWGADDRSLDHRLKQLDDFMEWGEARPIVPWGYDEQGVPCEMGGLALLRDQLKAQKPERLYTAAEAGTELHSFLRRQRRALQWLGLVEVSVGVGKTYQLRQLAAERALAGQYTVILSLDHGLLGQIRRDLLEAGVAVRHLHSLVQATDRTGAPECLIRNRPDVRALLNTGASLAGSVCPGCTHMRNNTCPAIQHSRRALQEYVILAPYAMARRAVDLILEHGDGGATLIVSDEEPPGAERVLVEEQAIREAFDNEAVWEFLRTDQTHVVQELMYAMLHGGVSEVPQELIDGATGYHGQLHAPKLTMLDLERFEGELAAIRGVLELAKGWSTLRKKGDDWVADVECEAWALLRQYGGFVLSATPNRRIYENFPLVVEELVLRVRDANTATRVVMYTQHGSRKHVLDDGEVNWEMVERDLDELFRLAPEPATILVGTYKAISDELKGPKAHLLKGRDVQLTHYEVVRGRDDWRERDVFCSLYDPRPPADSIEESTEAAARSLEQFHGRARDPQPRAQPAQHYHFGCVAPISWWADATDPEMSGAAVVRTRGPGKPPEPMSDRELALVRMFVGAAGGRANAAKAMGLQPHELANVVTGFKDVPADVKQKVESALASYVAARTIEESVAP